jgi:hypothetical protein
MTSEFDHNLPFQNVAGSDDAADRVDNVSLLNFIPYTTRITARHQHRENH